jgi:HK97 family phage major capsid protein
MTTVLELRQQRAGVWAQAQDFRERAARGEDMSGEDEAAWTRALDEVDRLGSLIENRERDAALETRFADVDEQTRFDARTPGDAGGSADQYREAFTRYLRGGLNGCTVEQRELLQANWAEFDGTRAQGTTTGSAGGYTVPEGFWAKVTETMAYYGGVLQAGAEVLNTSTGAKIPWPTNDDTANEGALLAENTQITEQDLAFGQKNLEAFTYTSKLIRISLQLLRDSGIDVEGFVAKKAGQRLGRIYNRHATLGTGASQPQGIITGATVGKTTAGATAITYNEIVDLVHSVDVAYRQAEPGSVGFMLHDLVLAYVRKIRDDSGGAGLGRPIWEPSVQVGVPDSLLSYKLTVNNHMASTVATTNKTIAFGNFNAGYVWRNVGNGQLMRLEERYADYLQVGFFAFGDADGLVQDTSAVKVLQQA